MTSSVERQYERLLRVAYPRQYRTRRGEELLGTLMDGAEPGRRRPAIGDMVDLLRHGLRVRTGLTADAAPGRIFALAAPFGLAVAAGLSVIALTYGELPMHGRGTAPFGELRHAQYGLGPFETTGVIIYGLVLLALACSLCAALRPARALSVLAIAAAAVTHEVSTHGGTAAPGLTLLVVLSLCLVPPACAPMRAVPAGSRTRLWSAVVVGVLSVLGPLIFSTPPWSGEWAADQREAFYRSGSGLVGLTAPAVPVIAALVVLGVASAALAHRRLEIWTAGGLVLLPAAAWTFGGARIAQHSPGFYRGYPFGTTSAFLGVLGLATGVVLLHVAVLRSSRQRDPATISPD